MLELNVTEEVRLKIREDEQMTPIDVTTSPSAISLEEQFLFTQADNEKESEEETIEKKKQSRQAKRIGCKCQTNLIEN